MHFAKCKLHKIEQEARNYLCLHFHYEVLNTSWQKLYFFVCLIKINFSLAIFVYFWRWWHFFPAVMPCFPISSGKFILEFSAGCLDRSLHSNNISDQNWGKCLRVCMDFCFIHKNPMTLEYLLFLIPFS